MRMNMLQSTVTIELIVRAEPAQNKISGIRHVTFISTAIVFLRSEQRLLFLFPRSGNSYSNLAHGQADHLPHSASVSPGTMAKHEQRQGRPVMSILAVARVAVIRS